MEVKIEVLTLQRKYRRFLTILDKIALVLAISSGPLIIFARREIKPILLFLATIPAVYLTFRAVVLLKELKQKEKSVRPNNCASLNLWVQLIINFIASFANPIAALTLLLSEETK